MSIEIIKIWKNMGTKQTRIGALVIIILVALVSLTTMFIPHETTASATWYDNSWSCKKEITLDYTKVPSTLTDFPVLINLASDADLASDAQADFDDIMFVNGAEDTKLSHEIEKYNSGTGQLVALVKIPSLSHTVNTSIYLYYGNAGCADQQDITNVWDSNYEGVWHLAETTGQHLDSTSNNHDSTTVSVTTQGSATSVAGGADAFDGANDYVLIPDATGMDTALKVADAFTMECWGKDNDGTISNVALISMYQTASEQSFLQYFAGGAFTQYYISTDDKLDGQRDLDESHKPTDTNYHYFVGTWNGGNANGDEEVFIDAVSCGESFVDGGGTDVLNEGTDDLIFGSRYDGDDPTQLPWNGNMDEFRISKTVRSDDWITTTYNTINDGNDGGFFTLKAEEEGGSEPSSFSIKGVSTPYSITWLGTGGDIVWCNSSGDKNEWMEINMTINATDNVTELRVWVGDLNDTTVYINASNISLYVSSDNSSYGLLGTFTDGGNNLSINASTWNAGTMGADPFAGVGLANKTASIYCIFKLAIPASSPTDMFYSASPTKWKVYLGYYT